MAFVQSISTVVQFGIKEAKKGSCSICFMNGKMSEMETAKKYIVVCHFLGSQSAIVFMAKTMF